MIDTTGRDSQNGSQKTSSKERYVDLLHGWDIFSLDKLVQYCSYFKESKERFALENVLLKEIEKKFFTLLKFEKRAGKL